VSAHDPLRSDRRLLDHHNSGGVVPDPLLLDGIALHLESGDGSEKEVGHGGHCGIRFLLQRAGGSFFTLPPLRGEYLSERSERGGGGSRHPTRSTPKVETPSVVAEDDDASPPRGRNRGGAASPSVAAAAGDPFFCRRRSRRLPPLLSPPLGRRTRLRRSRGRRVSTPDAATPTAETTSVVAEDGDASSPNGEEADSRTPPRSTGPACP